MKLSLWQRLELWLFGSVFLREEQKAHGTVNIFLVKCKKHGLYEDYPHGFRHYFMCPECEKERKI